MLYTVPVPKEVAKKWGRKEISYKPDVLTSEPIIISAPENPQPKDILITHEQILERIDRMAADIAANHKGENLLVLFALNGATTFGVHLKEALRKHGLDDAHYDSIRAESYGGKNKSGKLKIKAYPKNNIKGRNILVVEDIVDTGETMTGLEEKLIKKGAHAITTASLLSKPERRTVPYETDYTGFIIPNIWVEGFGLDTDEWNRDDPNIVVGYERPKIKKPSGFNTFATGVLSLAKQKLSQTGNIFNSRIHK